MFIPATKLGFLRVSALGGEPRAVSRIEFSGPAVSVSGNEATVTTSAQTTSGPNWRINNSTGELQIKDLASGKFHTLTIFGGNSIEIGAAET
jgi:hypothetical protein